MKISKQMELNRRSERLRGMFRGELAKRQHRAETVPQAARLPRRKEASA